MGEKRSATDFALWKFSPPNQKRAMEWESPWGLGFPGWHIECSAMAMHHLGETLDIHCGGSDHVRVHHTNEIAQSECATGKLFSRFWLHGEFLRMGGGKMSKSTGEFLTISLLQKKGFDPLDYRLFALTSHYRNYLNFTWEALENARESLKSLRRKTDPLIGKGGEIKSRSEEHTSELQSRPHLVCRLLLEKKNEVFRRHHLHRGGAHRGRPVVGRPGRRGLRLATGGARRPVRVSTINVDRPARRVTTAECL